MRALTVLCVSNATALMQLRLLRVAVIVKKRAESVIRHFPGRRGRLEPALPVLSEVEGSEVEGSRPKFFKIYCIFQKIYFFKKLYILYKM